MATMGFARTLFRYARLMRTPVITGTWLYDGTKKMRVVITAKAVEFASARYDDDEQLVSTAPIPHTADGYLYEVGTTSGGEFSSLEEAMDWVNAQPWGPVTWDR